MHIIITILTVNVSNKGQIHPLLAILEQCFDISVSCVTKFSILTGSFPPAHKMLKQVSLTLQTKNKIENPVYFSAPSIYWPISLPSIYNVKYLFTNFPFDFLLSRSKLTPIRFYPRLIFPLTNLLYLQSS